MKTISYLFFLSVVLSGCQPTGKSSVQSQDATATKKSRMDSVLMELSGTPDSLRTPEQKETIRKIQLMVAKYVEVKDGVFSFTLPKAEFVEKTGLGIEYYDVIIKNIDDNNSMIGIKGFNAKEAEESFNRMKQELLQEYQ